MENLKKIENRLEKLYRMQKKLEKKRKKLMRLAAETRKKSAAKTKKLAGSKLPAGADCLNIGSKKSIGRVILTSVGLAVFSTVVAVVVSTIVKRARVQKNAVEQMGAVDAELQEDIMNADYEKASLEELEEALLKVENQLDEVSKAIDENK